MDGVERPNLIRINDSLQIDPPEWTMSTGGYQEKHIVVKHPFGEKGCGRYISLIIECVKQIFKFLTCQKVNWPKLETVTAQTRNVCYELYEVKIPVDGEVANELVKVEDAMDTQVNDVLEVVSGRFHLLSENGDPSDDSVTDKCKVEQGEIYFSLKKKLVEKLNVFREHNNKPENAQNLASQYEYLPVALRVERVSDQEGRPIEVLLKMDLNGGEKYRKILPVKSTELTAEEIKTALLAGKSFPVFPILGTSDQAKLEAARSEKVFEVARQIGKLEYTDEDVNFATFSKTLLSNCIFKKVGFIFVDKEVAVGNSSRCVGRHSEVYMNYIGGDR